MKRSSNSLTVRVNASSGSEDLAGLFYVLKSGNNTLDSTSDQVEVTNLTAYTNVTVEVSACYVTTFCSEVLTIAELTNVGGELPVHLLPGGKEDILVS